MLRFRGKKIREWGWNHGIDFKLNKHWLFIGLDTNGCYYPSVFLKKLKKFIRYFKVYECAHSYDMIITWEVNDLRNPKKKLFLDNYGSGDNHETDFFGVVSFWYDNKLWDKELDELYALWRLSL